MVCRCFCSFIKLTKNFKYSFDLHQNCNYILNLLEENFSPAKFAVEFAVANDLGKAETSGLEIVSGLKKSSFFRDSNLR